MSPLSQLSQLSLLPRQSLLSLLSPLSLLLSLLYLLSLLSLLPLPSLFSLLSLPLQSSSSAIQLTAPMVFRVTLSPPLSRAHPGRFGARVPSLAYNTFRLASSRQLRGARLARTHTPSAVCQGIRGDGRGE